MKPCTDPASFEPAYRPSHGRRAALVCCVPSGHASMVRGYRLGGAVLSAPLMTCPEVIVRNADGWPQATCDGPWPCLEHPSEAPSTADLVARWRAEAARVHGKLHPFWRDQNPAPKRLAGFMGRCGFAEPEGEP
jgi:hypothetical protein